MRAREVCSRGGAAADGGGGCIKQRTGNMRWREWCWRDDQCVLRLVCGRRAVVEGDIEMYGWGGE